MSLLLTAHREVGKELRKRVVRLGDRQVEIQRIGDCVDHVDQSDAVERRHVYFELEEPQHALF